MAVRAAYEKHERPRPCTEFDPLTKKASDALITVMASLHSFRISPARQVYRLLECEEGAMEALRLSRSQRCVVEHILSAYSEGSCSAALSLAAARCAFIDRIAVRTVHRPPHAATVTEKLDSILLSRFFAVPVFITAALTAFWIAFGFPGSALKQLFEHAMRLLSCYSALLLNNAGVSSSVIAFFTQAVLGGVFTVLTFLPQFAFLFMFLFLLEDSGYMARATFVSDGILRRFWLTGRSFIPIPLGFGCSVPAIMAAGSLGTERERRLTYAVIPFMSCSAKLPVYGILSGVFFSGHEAAFTAALYFTGLIFALLCAAMLSRTKYRVAPPEFVMELPPYRFPGVHSLVCHCMAPHQRIYFKGQHCNSCCRYDHVDS